MPKCIKAAERREQAFERASRRAEQEAQWIQACREREHRDRLRAAERAMQDQDWALQQALRARNSNPLGASERVMPSRPSAASSRRGWALAIVVSAALLDGLWWLCHQGA